MTQENASEIDEGTYEAINGFVEQFRNGGVAGQLLDITEEECEALYALGYSLYQQQRYNDAFKAFSLLVIYDHLEPRYQMALGASAQALGRFEDALRQYAVVAVMRIDDPTPLFHSAECLIAMGHTAQAVESLELAIEMAEAKGNEALLAKSRAIREKLLSVGKSQA
ncbi:MAG: SycD/LcrH family type III secretion system chaperone [Candidimonas sp.]